jgi:hypothetical protein
MCDPRWPLGRLQKALALQSHCFGPTSPFGFDAFPQVQRAAKSRGRAGARWPRSPVRSDQTSPRPFVAGFRRYARASRMSVVLTVVISGPPGGGPSPGPPIGARRAARELAPVVLLEFMQVQVSLAPPGLPVVVPLSSERTVSPMRQTAPLPKGNSLAPRACPSSRAGARRPDTRAGRVVQRQRGSTSADPLHGREHVRGSHRPVRRRQNRRLCVTSGRRIVDPDQWPDLRRYGDPRIDGRVIRA